MKMKRVFPIALGMLAVTAGMQSCHRQAAAELVPATVVNMASPRAIVYKTRADYSHHVPVMLSADKKTLMSYPACSDVRHLPVPTPLADGWLLDNRGIGAHVAFTTWTYEEYAAMETTPSRHEIMAHILDADPLVAAYMCAPRHNYNGREQEMLNRLIAEGFPGCERLK